MRSKPTINHSKGKRAEQVAQGAYDGRFRPRVIKDKKKHASKNWARKSK
jgi:hypothetical protein